VSNEQLLTRIRLAWANHHAFGSRVDPELWFAAVERGLVPEYFAARDEARAQHQRRQREEYARARALAQPFAPQQKGEG
jgi:hypothetical protein